MLGNQKTVIPYKVSRRILWGIAKTRKAQVVRLPRKIGLISVFLAYFFVDI